MQHADVGLPANLLYTVFPFHIALDPDLRIVQVGDALRRRLTDLTPATSLRELFHIVEPQGASTFDAMRKQTHSLFVLELAGSDLTLKGQMVYLQERDLLLFLGSPWLTGAEDLGALRLSLNEYPTHDVEMDAIVALQTHQVAPNDARHERDVALGARIQQALLIAAPPYGIEGADISAITLPSLQIDGDYLDFFGYDTSRFDVLVGDVMGKGVPAALLSAAAKGHFQRAARHLAGQLQPFKRRPEPEEIVGAVHTVLSPELVVLESFMTLCYARFDLERSRVSIVDCGHPRTLYLKRDTGCCTALEGENLPFGVRTDEVYRQRDYPFGPGDVFLFYSDGVTEARSPDGALFGEDRLIDVLRGGIALTANEIIARVRTAVMDFAETDDLSDDLTCVAVVIAEHAPELPVSQVVLEMYSSTHELERFGAIVREVAAPHLDPDALHRLVLAGHEAVVNIIRHAYNGASNRRLQVIGQVFADRVRLAIYDWGAPLVPESVAEPVFDGSREGGWGLYIIEQCVDEVHRSRDEMGRNCLALTVRIRQELYETS
jgi:sigma-B regulation protein RsbU (phosphoserine phosphatase)